MAGLLTAVHTLAIISAVLGMVTLLAGVGLLSTYLREAWDAHFERWLKATWVLGLGTMTALFGTMACSVIYRIAHGLL